MTRIWTLLQMLLINLYSDAIYREALFDRSQGIEVNRVITNNVRYADDTVLIANNTRDLQCDLDREVAKTKFMVVGKQQVGGLVIAWQKEWRRLNILDNYLTRTGPIQKKLKPKLIQPDVTLYEKTNVLCGCVILI